MMYVKFPKERGWSEELYQRALEFHGHGGPFMVLGLRMGLLALRMLDAKGWFDIKCKVRLHWNPPDSCVIDGIQISTGCTTGKKNLEIYDEDEGISAEFTKQKKSVKIKIKNEVLDNIKDILEKKSEKLEELINKLKKADPSEIFIIV